MTIITVTGIKDKFDRSTKQRLAERLSTTVMAIECGRKTSEALLGFQVHYKLLSADDMAFGGKLACDQAGQNPIVVDVCVMAGDWPEERRSGLIVALYEDLVQVFDEAVNPGWWITFHELSERSWGLNKYAASLLDFLDTEIFSPERKAAIRKSLTVVDEG